MYHRVCVCVCWGGGGSEINRIWNYYICNYSGYKVLRTRGPFAASFYFIFILFHGVVYLGCRAYGQRLTRIQNGHASVPVSFAMSSIKPTLGWTEEEESLYRAGIPVHRYLRGAGISRSRTRLMKPVCELLLLLLLLPYRVHLQHFQQFDALSACFPGCLGVSITHRTLTWITGCGRYVIFLHVCKNIYMHPGGTSERLYFVESAENLNPEKYRGRRKA